MTDQPNDQEKKIIIDEDWKSQVEAEKQAAELYQPGLGARGWRLDDDRLVSIRRAAAMGDLHYAKLARKALPGLITPKPSIC